MIVLVSGITGLVMELSTVGKMDIVVRENVGLPILLVPVQNPVVQNVSPTLTAVQRLVPMEQHVIGVVLVTLEHVLVPMPIQTPTNHATVPSVRRMDGILRIVYLNMV